MPLAIHAFALDEHLSICFTDRCDEDLFWSSDGAEAQVEVWVFVLASNGCSLLFPVSLFFLLVRVALKLRSLRHNTPRLCRSALF